MSIMFVVGEMASAAYALVGIAILGRWAFKAATGSPRGLAWWVMPAYAWAGALLSLMAPHLGRMVYVVLV